MKGKKSFLSCGILLILLLSGCNSNNTLTNVSKTPSSQIVRHPLAADYTKLINNGEKLKSLPIYQIPTKVGKWI
jgi:PBP1b-binding outer membrane lipoprotein LpoB